MKKLLVLLVALTLAACAPQEQALRSPVQAPKIMQDAYITSDEAKLPLRRWKLSKPKAIIIAVHGFNDYSNAFTGAGAYFKKRGIMTYAYDQRGFGKTEDRGIWANKENLTRDLGDFTRLVAKRHRGVPLFLLGESMGGAVVMLTASEQELPIKGILLSAPAVWGDGHMPLPYRMLLWGMAHTLPGYTMTGQNLRILASNNIPMLQALSADPLVIKSTRVDSIYGLSQLMNNAYATPPHIKNRTLLLYGFKDLVIPREPIEDIKDNFPTPPDTLFYENGYHMLTRDLQGERVLADMTRWMLHHRH
jgi:acylglycerol lipase